MIKLLTIIGARPQIIKAAALSREIKSNYNAGIKELLLHTGQHYDRNMSEVFFSEMNIPKPDFNLSIGSGLHGHQTSKMILGIENILQTENPDYVVLYGDTNSTLAGAIAASKIHIPIIHIEAGLRSFNKAMPEEINRIMCDHVSTLLFTPTQTGIKNLVNEGIVKDSVPPYSINNPGVFHCGDIMYDNSLFFREIAKEKSNILDNLFLNGETFILGTIHREYNTDDVLRFNSIFRAICNIAEKYNESFVFALHPRTSKQIEKNLESNLKERLFSSELIKLIPPVSYLDMLQLEQNTKMIITDSGGLQKESYFFRKPVIVLRPETEWVEIIANKAGRLANADEKKIENAYLHLSTNCIKEFPSIFGDGNAASFICKTILNQLNPNSV